MGDHGVTIDSQGGPADELVRLREKVEDNLRNIYSSGSRDSTQPSQGTVSPEVKKDAVDSVREWIADHLARLIEIRAKREAIPKAPALTTSDRGTLDREAPEITAAIQEELQRLCEAWERLRVKHNLDADSGVPSRLDWPGPGSSECFAKLPAR